MRGLLLFSVIGLGLAACGPSKPPADASNPPEDSSSSSSSSSESTPSTHTKPAPSSDEATPPPGAGGSSSAGAAADTSPTPPPAADSGPHLPPDFGGRSYDREAAEVVLRRAARQVKTHCGGATDDSGKPSGPWGKTSVSVKMGHNGHSKSATIPAPFDGKPPGKCATQAFVNMQYPPFGGTDTVVDWEVEIVKPGG